MSLVELMLALTLSALLCAVVAGPFIATERAARLHSERLAIGDALRIPAIVLGGELRWIDPAADIVAVARDSIALRAFRGVAIVCDIVRDGVRVRYRGLRRPDADKDSVLVIAGRGASSAARAVVSSVRDGGTSVGGCPGPPRSVVYRWTLQERPAPGALLLLFERGSYHVAERAFRFRRGDGGRQPLTAERFDDAASRFDAVDARGRPAASPGDAVAAVLRVVVATSPSGRRTRMPAVLERARVPFLNRPVGPTTRAATDGDP